MKFRRSPKPYAWPEEARLALSIVVNVEEGAEANILDGDKSAVDGEPIGQPVVEGV